MIVIIIFVDDGVDRVDSKPLFDEVAEDLPGRCWSCGERETTGDTVESEFEIVFGGHDGSGKRWDAKEKEKGKRRSDQREDMTWIAQQQLGACCCEKHCTATFRNTYDYVARWSILL